MRRVMRSEYKCKKSLKKIKFLKWTTAEELQKHTVFTEDRVVEIKISQRHCEAGHPYETAELGGT